MNCLPVGKLPPDLLADLLRRYVRPNPRVVVGPGIGIDAAILVAGASSEFQLNVMQPLVAWNLLSSIGLLSAAARALADKAVAGFTVNRARVADALRQNPAIVTALAQRIGYDRCAEIVRESSASGTSIAEVARKMLGMSSDEVQRLLDPERMTHPGFPGREP